MKIHPVEGLQEQYIIGLWKKPGEKNPVCIVLEDEEGSFTLEASFLVPLVCFLVFAMMITGLYQCDQNYAKSFLNRRSVELSKNDEEYTFSELEQDREELKEGLFITEVTGFSLTKQNRKINGEVEISLRVSLPMISSWIGDLWKARFSIAVDTGDCVEQIRRWNQIE